MPVALPNIYCSPNDVFDYLSTSGGQLRMDDDQLATGQVITPTATAVAGATAISIAPLVFPLLKGSSLVFEGAGMASQVTATLSATASRGAISLSVLALSDDVNAQSQATDNGVNVYLASLVLKGCKYATGRVKFYCANRYDDSQLVNSWSVNRWSTALAGQWSCRRRSQSAPKGVDEDVKEALEEMKGVAMGSYNIEDIGTRTSAWPFFSNMTMDLRYDVARARVEPQISEGTPTNYGQYVDWSSILSVQW